MQEVGLRAAKIVANMLSFGHFSESIMTLTNINQLIKTTIEQVILNLVRNAAQAIAAKHETGYTP